MMSNPTSILMIGVLILNQSVFVSTHEVINRPTVDTQMIVPKKNSSTAHYQKHKSMTTIPRFHLPLKGFALQLSGGTHDDGFPITDIWTRIHIH